MKKQLLLLLFLIFLTNAVKAQDRCDISTQQTLETLQKADTFFYSIVFNKILRRSATKSGK
ncbi:MAG: hypothetical protein ABI686_05605 [Acidobacteriota bacterium]